MPDLRLLDCSGAKLDGSLPEDGTLGRLTNLVCLNLSHNELCGRLPESLANLRNLRRLRINDNQLDGPIPKKLFENLTKLTVREVAVVVAAAAAAAALLLLLATQRVNCMECIPTSSPLEDGTLVVGS
jgi:hypothetical protein